MADTFSKGDRSRIMAAVRSKNTAPELIVRRLVHSLGYRYRLHVRELPGTPDLVFPRFRRIIIVNGCFWHMHGCGRCRIPATHRGYWIEKLHHNTTRDKRNLRVLRKAGWGVLVVWECQTRTLRLGRLKARIVAFLDRNLCHRGSDCLVESTGEGRILETSGTGRRQIETCRMNVQL